MCGQIYESSVPQTEVNEGGDLHLEQVCPNLVVSATIVYTFSEDKIKK
jgi:hypothetical protein